MTTFSELRCGERFELESAPHTRGTKTSALHFTNEQGIERGIARTDVGVRRLQKNRKHEYKIVHNRDFTRSNVANEGGWQVKIRQYPDGVTGEWFDAGDPCDTRQEAEAKLAAFMDHDKGLRMRDDGRWEPNE